MNRKEYNIELLKLVEKMVIRYPEFRFSQILINMNLIDKELDFYEESRDMFRRVSNTQFVQETENLPDQTYNIDDDIPNCP